uniref:Protein kinase domain-containing protein n=1 Tax=Physcomitrium patens TaxID=3218 RepID=A0A7I4CZ08_PHYPA
MDTEFEEVKQEIRKVEQQIDAVEEQLTKAVTEADVAYWRNKEEQLREEKKQLRKKEEQLREKELLLLNADTSAAQQDALDPFRRLLVEARVDVRIPEVTELKGYLLHPPRMAFPVSHRRYFQWKSYLSKADNFICHDPARGVCWNLDDHLGIVLRPPATGSTESSYHAYWDCLVTEPISLFSLETLVFDRDTSRFSSSENKRPDKLGMVSRLALWRGEEKGPDTEDDPKQELVRKLIWTDKRTFEKVYQIYKSIKDCPNAEQVLKINAADRRFRMIPRCLVKSRARPEDELLKALINVAEALVWLHGKNLMHRDITWRNVLRNTSGTNWVLIDFDETAATPCGHAHGLCVEAHAPEMSRGRHDSSVDIWGIGHLIRSSGINGLSAGVRELQRDCLQTDASRRPNAETCLERLKCLRRMTNMNLHMDFESC